MSAFPSLNGIDESELAKGIRGYLKRHYEADFQGYTDTEMINISQVAAAAAVRNISTFKSYEDPDFRRDVIGDLVLREINLPRPDALSGKRPPLWECIAAGTFAVAMADRNYRAVFEKLPQERQLQAADRFGVHAIEASSPLSNKGFRLSDPKHDHRDAFEVIGEMLRVTGNFARRRAEGVKALENGIARKLEQLGQSIRNLVSRTRQGVSEFTADAGAVVREAATALRDTGGEALGIVKDAAGAARDRALEAGGRAKGEVVDAGRTAMDAGRGVLDTGLRATRTAGAAVGARVEAVVEGEKEALLSIRDAISSGYAAWQQRNAEFRDYGIEVLQEAQAKLQAGARSVADLAGRTRGAVTAGTLKMVDAGLSKTSNALLSAAAVLDDARPKSVAALSGGLRDSLATKPDGATVESRKDPSFDGPSMG